LPQIPSQTLESHREPKDFVALVLGASAGGLAAIRQLFQGAPLDQQRFAVILVMHIDGSGQDLAHEVMGQTSGWPVLNIAKGVNLKPGSLYLVPPHSTIAIKGLVFDCREALAYDHRQSVIDAAFRAVAKSFGPRTIGVVLSGEGADGSQGLIPISQAGGMTIAQDPESTEHKSMPQNAIASGLIDHVLEPSRMPEILNAYSAFLTRVSASDGLSHLKEQIAAVLIPICEILHKATQHDFKHYKTSTLVRRIQRRMQVLQVTSVDAYVEMLESHHQEAEALINVTSFFRDPEAFHALRDEVIAKALTTRSNEHKYRVWVAGCSTGEEAYSLAIMIKEVLCGAVNAPDIQIIATDIDEHALTVARRGAYSQSAVSSLPPEILTKYFIRKGGRYHIIKDVRELCLFSVHNLINDPPFSQLDLISCRNVLIYLGLHLQKKLIPVFHYALKPGGHLFLGNSESLSTHKELFRAISARHRIAQRKATAIRTLSHFSASITAYPSHPQEPVKNIETDLNLVGQRIVLDEFTPKYAIVNDEGQIVSVSSGITQYFELSEGSFQNNILKVVHPNLRVALRTIFAQAKTEKRQFMHEAATLKVEGVLQRVGLVVQPMPQLGEEIALYMVVFRYLGVMSEGELSVKGFDPQHVNTAFVEQLETELAATRDQLDRTIQDLEASNEELKSSNEELLSMNEELQSANEELEASKEDIQNVNEALLRTNSDLENLLASTQIATLFLDENLNIKNFTPAVAQIYNIMERDVGRSIYDLTHRAEHMPKFPAPHQLETLGSAEFEIFMPENTIFLRRVTPYVNHENERDGIVATFIDITALRRSEGLFRALADSMPQIVFVSDELGHISYLNEQWFAYTGTGNDKTAYRHAEGFIHPDDAPLVKSAWQKAQSTESAFELEFRLRSKAGQYRWFMSRAFPIFEQGQLKSWFGTSTDIHESKKAALELERTLQRLSLAQKAGQLGAFEWDLGRKVEWTAELEAIYGLKTGSFERTFEAFLKRIHPGDVGRVKDGIQNAMEGHGEFNTEFRIQRPDGSERWVVGRGETIRDAQGHAVSFVGVNVDITKQKQIELELAARQKEILEAARLYKSVVSALTEGVVIADHSGQIVDMNDEALKMHGFHSRSEMLALAEDYAPFFHLKTLDFKPIDLHEWPIRRMLRGERFRNFEVWVETQERTWLASYCGSPVLDDSGRIIAGVLSIRDITPQKDVENRIRELADSMTQLAWTAQPNGDVNWYNRRWFEYTGTTHEQMLGWGWQSVQDPKILPEVMTRWTKSISDGTAFDMTFPLRGRDGGYRWFLTRAFPLKDSAGNIIQWFGTNTDVHEQVELTDKLKASEANLHEKTDQLQLALRAGKLGTFQWHLLSGEASWSEQAYRLFGYESERPAVTFDFFLKSVHPDDQSRVKKIVDEAIATGGSFEVEFRTHPGRGQVRWLLENGLVARDTGNAPLYILGTIQDVSARKFAQIEFERRVDVSPAILWITEKDGSCSYLSQQWYNFTGQTPEEALGYGWLDATHPDDKERTGEIFRLANAKGEPFYIEYRLRTHDGSYRWAIDAGNPRFDADGQFLGYAGTVFDIHDRIVAEEEVKTSEQRLRSQQQILQTITDNAASCLFMMDRNGHPTFMNQAARRLTGYESLSEIADRPLHYAVHWKKPDGSHYPMEECPIDNAQNHCKIMYNQEEIFTDKFGRLFPVEYSVSPLEKDGEIVGSVLEFRDVSEQKKVMEELELSRRSYKLLFESTPIPMWIFTADSRRFVDVNEAAVKHYGYSKAEFLALPVDQLFAEDSRLFFDKIATSTETDRPLHLSAVFSQLKKGGTLIQVELAASSLILGTESSFIVAAHDVTEKVRIEAEQRQWQMTLEKAKLAAEAANRAKSSFLANMSHEIRTPLGAILGFTELLKDPVTDDAEKQEYLEVITRNGEQLTAIIDDILDLSKVEAGHLKLQLSDISPQALMKDIHALLSVKAKAKGIELEASFDASVPRVMSTDETRFRQILINIVGNGIKFTAEGHVKTRVRYETRGQGNYLILEVSDSGVGIDPVHQSRLFQPFSQADESTTRRFGGTGLGLSLSRRLAEALGGTVELLRSEPGQGSCFGIVIEDKGPQDEKPSEKITVSPIQGDLRGLHILVADDSIPNQQLLIRILTKAGAFVDIAQHGLEATEKVKEGSFDLVLMDVQMPRMDGLTAVKTIREWNRDLPVLALTAHAMDEAKRECLAAGYTDYLSKPINMKLLIEKVCVYTAKK
jgi:two-component system CheB/CheR fusion protein